MTLGQIAFACFIFSRLDSGGYERLVEETDGVLDLSKLSHCLATLRWLSTWGVRSIPKRYHREPSDTSNQLQSWYADNNFFDRIDGNRDLWDLDDNHLTLVHDVFDSLVANVNLIGPTAAAKILFALRPRAFIPWDSSIQNEWGYNGSGESYVIFLVRVQRMIQELEALCMQYNFELAELPERLGRPNSSIPKIIDEYLWVTITKNCTPATNDLLRWAEWSI